MTELNKLPTKLRRISFVIHMEELCELIALLNFETSVMTAHSVHRIINVPCNFSPN